jgi:hypothetical protein
MRASRGLKSQALNRRLQRITAVTSPSHQQPVPVEYARPFLDRPGESVTPSCLTLDIYPKVTFGRGGPIEVVHPPGWRRKHRPISRLFALEKIKKEQKRKYAQ